MSIRTLCLPVLVAATLVAAAPARAEYPDRPIKLVVASAAGSSADLLARTYAEKLKARLGQPVVVDNKPGATGAIGAEAVAKAPGDGYTLLLNSSALAINPWITKQSFNFMKDLTPIARTADTPYLVTVSGQSPARNLDEFIAHLKSHPGTAGCATYGVGSPPHLALELFKQAAGLKILHVPYKTSALALPELLSGQLDCIVEPPPGSIPQLKSGRVRIIAHTGDKALPTLPGVEPIGRRFPQATVVGWQAIFAPASTPEPIVERLRTEWAKLLADPEVEQKIRDAGFQPATGTARDFAKAIESDYERFGRIIRDTGIRLE